MSKISACGTKNQIELSEEWDRLAPERHRQIVSGEDLSFDHVLTPMILSMLEGANLSLVLDIGSGTGDLTLRLAKVCQRVIGIDPSHISVDLAKANRGDAKNLTYIQDTLEHAAPSLLAHPPSAAVLAMTLMTAPSVAELAKSLASLLPVGAQVVATLCHPCFWPRYWGYEQESWFRYDKEIFIEAPFVISRSRSQLKTTHIHRPLYQYLDVFAASGFRLISALEPIPATDVQKLYPQPWRFPRFMGLKWLLGEDAAN